MQPRTDNPKVFISYSWSSVEHENWVLSLAERLISNGVNVVLDKWELREGQDKNKFMEKMVNDSSIEKVLIICDKAYMDKANMRKGGAGTETEIISSEVYNNMDQEKFIPVVREYENGKPCKPTYLESRLHFDLSETANFYEEYEKVLRNIFNRPIYKKPSMGAPPAYLFEEEPSVKKTGYKAQAFLDAFNNGKPISLSLFDDYLSALYEGFIECKVSSGTSGEAIDDQILSAIETFTPYRNEFTMVVAHLCNNRGGLEYFYKVHDFLTRAVSFIDPAISSSKLPERDACQFVIYELFLYLVTVLINQNYSNALNIFLDEDYMFSSSVHGKLQEGYDVFNFNIHGLNETRKKRLGLKLKSVQAQTLIDRINAPKFSDEQIIQADLILFIYSTINSRDPHMNWYPRTLIYSFQITAPLDLFHKARMIRHYEFLKNILKIKDIEDLIVRLNKAEYQNKLGESYWRTSMSLDRLLNLKELLLLHCPQSSLLTDHS